MAKNRSKNRNNHNRNIVPKLKKQMTEKPVEKKSELIVIKPWYKSMSTKILAGAGVIVTIFGLVQFLEWGYGKTQSDHDKFIDDEYIRGILYPKELQKKNDTIFIIAAGFRMAYTLPKLREGISIKPNIYACVSPIDGSYDNPMNLKLKLEGEVIKVSTTIRDIYSKAEIGLIENNKWGLRKRFIGDYLSNDTQLSVWDNSGYLALGISLIQSNVLIIEGYFPGSACTGFIYGSSLEKPVMITDPMYSQKCEARLQKSLELHPLHLANQTLPIIEPRSTILP